MGLFLTISVLTLTSALGQAILKTPGGSAVQMPSDSELKASYCIAVVKNWLGDDEVQIHNSEFNMNKEMDSKKKSQWAQILQANIKERAEDADNLNRLQSFLNPKLSFLESRSLSSAYKRGETDVVSNKNSGTSEQCIAKCKGQDGNINVACTKQCMEADPLSHRVAQCGSLEFLPF